MTKQKNQETQNIEWKAAWRDDCLKWVCGFANAQGGVLVIGRNDKGEAVGVRNAERLLEDLPNKIRSAMGIVVDVNLRSQKGLDTIEITVPAYPNAISYHGKYYFRTGSTNQELSGYALDELLMRKYGRAYDSMPLPGIKLKDFWHDAFDVFRKKAVASKRLMKEDVDITDAELLRSLRLTGNNRPLLAAALVFHQTPEQWCFGAAVKIGRFKDDARILYQDELTGAVVGMADKVVEIIFTKYFMGRIRFEGLQRIDDYPMPREALREAVMNALVHRDYSTGSPIQIRVYGNRVTIANDCRLPEGTTWKTLSTAHKSLPHNPLVAGAMFRSGQIEAWGRGIERMVNACTLDNLPAPEFFITPQSFTICFHTRDTGDPESGMINGENDIINGKDGAINGKDEMINGENEMINGRNEMINGRNEMIKENIKAILSVIKGNPAITIPQLVKVTGKTRITISRELQKYQAAGVLRREGARKNGRWVVCAEQGEGEV